VVKKIIPLSVDIQGHWERVNFDVTRINIYDAVLKLSWLAQHTPTINYKDRTMVFDGCECKPTRNINIEEMLVRAMNAYFR
jgi:hypothetical protein